MQEELKEQEDLLAEQSSFLQKNIEPAYDVASPTPGGPTLGGPTLGIPTPGGPMMAHPHTARLDMDGVDFESSNFLMDGMHTDPGPDDMYFNGRESYGY